MRNLLCGENVKLNALRESDIPIIEDWFNDVEFLRLYDMLPAIPQRTSDVKKTIEDFAETKERMMFAIRTLDGNRLLGITGFFDIMWTNGVATFFIGIGDNDFVGKGIGIEAIKLLLDFGFNELNLHRIQLNVISYNTRAIKAYEKAGFIKEGVYRELVHREGLRYDLYLYGLLREEWVNKGKK